MQVFEDEDFQFGFELVLGATYHQSADVGEALATAARIPDGDADAWIREWGATATRAFDAGEHARHAGRRATALSFYRRAARYYSTALYCAAKASDFGAQRVLATWRRQHECWSTPSTSRPLPASGCRSPTSAPRCVAGSSARPMQRSGSRAHW